MKNGMVGKRHQRFLAWLYSRLEDGEEMSSGQIHSEWNSIDRKGVSMSELCGLLPRIPWLTPSEHIDRTAQGYRFRQNIWFRDEVLE